MSESGWRAFLAASGVDDWAVLHGGPTAVYRTSSLADAAALAQAIAAVPGLNGTHAQINLLSDRVTVRLTRDQLVIEEPHIELARAVSVVAKAHGAVADRSAVNEVQVAISAKPDAIDLGFWRAVLGCAPMQSDNAIDPLGNSSTVWMQDLDEAKPLRHAMHIDVSCRANRPRLDSLPRWRLGAWSWMRRMRRPTGSSPIARGTRSASPPGQTAPRRSLRARTEPPSRF